MRQILITAFVVGLLLVGSEKAHADALGLPDGTYDITLDFFLDSFDASGTMIIGPAPSFVTSFDAGVLDCTNCELGSSTPDTVEENNGLDFRILDPGSLVLVTLSSGGSAFATFKCPVDITCSFSAGEWSARAVPEPTSSALLLLGVGVLALRARKQNKSRR